MFDREDRGLVVLCLITWSVVMLTTGIALGGTL
jgi:hypothetical protein